MSGGCQPGAMTGTPMCHFYAAWAVRDFHELLVAVMAAASPLEAFFATCSRQHFRLMTAAQLLLFSSASGVVCEAQDCSAARCAFPVRALQARMALRLHHRRLQ